MSETEITLARGYLAAADQDPVAALIRSVKDLAHTRRMLDALPSLIAKLGEGEIAPRPPRAAQSDDVRLAA